MLKVNNEWLKSQLKLVKKIVPKKEDTTIRLIVQQDVAENVRQLFQAISQLKDKDINNAISIGERIAKIFIIW